MNSKHHATQEQQSTQSKQLLDGIAVKNTDKEIWRGKSRAEFGDDDRFYADSLFIPESEIEALGINCGGTVIVKPIREWHELALREAEAKSMAEDWLNEHKKVWSAHDLFTLIRLIRPNYKQRA